MSGIAGILRRDGRPVATEELVAMTDTMVHRGPDGISQWRSGPAGLAHCMLRTTPQSLVESQPLRAESDDICLTMDGRLDNRDELARALGAGGSLRTASDAEMVLRCYDRWGTGCMARIIGDFALAIWDGTRQRLICGRDILGKRSFYYSSTRSSFRFASEPQAVLVDPSVPRTPNKGMVGEFLSVRVTSTTETLFEDLLRLPPAHFLVVTPDAVRVTRYWDWDPGAEIRYRTDREYADHLLEVCGLAMKARLPSTSPLAVSLSGGVDSTSVLGLVRHLRAQGHPVGPLEVFSMVYPGRSCDESSYIRAVALAHQVEVHQMLPAAVGAGPYEAQVRRYLDVPDYPMTMMHRGYWAAARKRGCRALLTGKGPDEWLAGSYFSLADRLRRPRFRSIVEDVRGAAGSGARAKAGHVWTYGIEPLLPSRVPPVVRGALAHSQAPNLIRNQFRREIHLDDRVRAQRGPASGFAAGGVAGNLTDGWQAHANELADRAMASAGLEARDVFDDRRVVEFALAVPEAQRRRGELTKYVLREAMTGLIPEEVRIRRDKGNYSHLICEELRLQGGAKLFANLALDEMGWVDGRRAADMYEHLDRNYRAGNTTYHRHMWPLWILLSVERWVGATV